MGDGEAHSDQAVEDAALVARTLRGDEAAYETLIRRHFRAAFAVARAHASNEHDAEDVCQTAMFRAYQRLRDCSHPERFAAWLLRIVRNEAINWRERERVRSVAPLDDARDAPSPPVERPDAVLAAKELRRVLAIALAELPHIQREVIVLHDVDGFTHAEIARLLEISELMSRRHVSDGRKRLRELLGRDIVAEDT